VLAAKAFKARKRADNAAPAKTPAEAGSASSGALPGEDHEPAGASGAPLFAVGDKVRICSEAYLRNACGVEGTVERMKGDFVFVRTDAYQQYKAATAAVRKLADLTEKKRMKNLTCVSAAHRAAWLVQCGFQDHAVGEDTFEGQYKRLAGVDPVYIGVQHIMLWFYYIKWALELEAGARQVECVEPELACAWLGGTVEAEDLEDVTKQWRVILKQCSRSNALVLVPLWKSEHWVLLVLDHAEQTCRYYDSLEVQSESCHLVADYFVGELKKSDLEELAWLPNSCPCRHNKAKQGPMECGFFVCHYMEAECRAMLGEGRCSNGWPKPLEVRRALEKFMGNMLPAAMKMEAEVKLLEEDEDAAVEAHDKAAAAAAAAGAVGDCLKTLAQKAAAAMNAGMVGAPEVFDVEEEGGLEVWAERMLAEDLLMQSHKDICLHLKDAGLGVCSSCKWRFGCHRCSWAHAVRYWRFKEVRGELLEGYAPAAKAKAKAKAKGKGRGAEPKHAAAKAPGKGRGRGRGKMKMPGGGPPLEDVTIGAPVTFLFLFVIFILMK